ncbi:NHLP family bacteriocin export ABC transporter peptidase/permease/ATPase subunit [Salibacterium sp. K-3]
MSTPPKTDNPEKKFQKKVKIPTVLQMEAVECGAASLAMILAYYGSWIPLEQLRLDCGVSRDGSKAANLLKAARKYHLDTKAYRKEPEELKYMKPPFIVHWNFNHFLVVEGFKKNKVYLNDPVNGRRVISEEEFDEGFTGIVLTFEPTSDFEKKGEDRSFLKLASNRLQYHKSGMLFIILAGLALIIPGLLVPVFSQIFVDEVLLGSMDHWLFPLLFGMGLTALLRGSLTWIQQYYLMRMENKMALAESSKFMWHLLRLPMYFFQQRYAGDLASRVELNDKIANLLTGKLAVNVINSMTVVFYLGLMIFYNVYLAGIVVVLTLLNVLFLRIVSEKRTTLSQKMGQDQGNFMGVTMSGLSLIESIKASGTESDFFSKWSGHQAKVINATQTLGIFGQLVSSVPMLINTLTNIIVLLIGGWFILNGQITIGALVAFQTLAKSFFNPVNEIVQMMGEIQDAKGYMSRIDDVLAHEEEEHLPENSVESSGRSKLTGSVELEEVSFGYSILESPFISQFSLQIQPGERIALVGMSGSGKSTLSKLMTGLHRPWAGRIRFDGQPRSEISAYVMALSMSIVDQDIHMFEGTIKDNITLWDDTISEAAVVQAAKDACIHEDIMDKREGYEHWMEEDGRNFSGGQKQRLEIARALVENPSILIFDEATSALDPQTEFRVMENIRGRGCTCVIVAHRLSTIRDCDQIIVLESGSIIQQGKHEQLKAEEGPYMDLVASQ